MTTMRNFKTIEPTDRDRLRSLRPGRLICYVAQGHDDHAAAVWNLAMANQAEWTMEQAQALENEILSSRLTVSQFLEIHSDTK